MACDRLKNGETKVNFISTNSPDTPNSVVIEPEVMEQVKNFRSKASRWLGKQPISPKWKVNSIEVVLCASIEKSSQIVQVNDNGSDMSECEIFSSLRVVETIAELGVACKGHR